MWSDRERDELSVWADALQAKGDALGELITTSLQLESQAAPGDTATLTPLRARLAELQAEVNGPIEALFAEFPELEPTWEHGLVVALRVVDHPLERQLGQRPLDSLARLLRLPVTRFLRYLRVDARARDWSPIHASVAAILVEPEVVARPWVVILGAPPRHMRRRGPAHAFGRAVPELDPLVALDRGLRSLFLDTVRLELPWQAGDKGARLQAARRMSARPQLDDPQFVTRLARAVWDPSLRVRLEILDVVPLLGIQAAPLVPELLLVERGELQWISRVREVLDTLGRNPQIVDAVARNFTADQTRCARWLAASPLLVAQQAGPRIASMLERPGPSVVWARRELEDARRRIAYHVAQHREAQSLDSRSPTGQPLFRRLRRLFG
jgi:hypothetical protein